MSVQTQTFTKEAQEWVKFLSGVSNCYFIGKKSTGKNNEEYGKFCLKPSMKKFMQENGWIYQEYACGYFNGTEGSCTNGDNCTFGHNPSPRWVKAKPRRNFGSSSQASSRDNTTSEGSSIPDEVSVVSTVTSASEQWPSVSQSSAPLSSGSWNGRDIISPPETRKFSSDPKIKKWQERLYEAEDILCELKSDPDFDEDTSNDAIHQCEEVIEKAKKKIAVFKKAKADEKAKKAFSWADDDSSDDEA